MRVGFSILLLGLFLCTSSFAEESFITNEEYAKMLYKNPRGISCAKCHGERGEGKVITSYTSPDGTKHEIKAPPIYNVSMKRFKKALKRKGRLMPEYFLTEWEMAHLYYYLLTQNPNYQKKKEKKNDS